MNVEGTKVRMYQPGDEEGIIRLFNSIFPREMTLEEWRWKYLGRGNTKVYSSVVVDQEQGIVAHYGGVPHRMTYLGKEVYGLAIGDVMVHPRFRHFKTFKKMAELVPDEAARDGFILGYGFPSERALKLPEKLGLYEKVEDIVEANKDIASKNNLSRFFYKFFPLDYNDERIEKLWDECKMEIGLGVIRDRAYFKWRYRDHPFMKYELWGLRHRIRSSLVGLAVLKKEPERILLMDFLVRKIHLNSLISKIENYTLASCLKRLTVWIPPYLEEAFQLLGYSTAPAGTCIPRTTHEKGLTKKEIEGRFFYTFGDTDFQ
ncbi:MAG: GNAT family N-acetyltransferase [Nitrospirae bacterium]|nr:MAG: GNAT family N-acetyltransferase [Nitrospirota bacterium]